jgi:hypothetical protein
LVTRLQPMLQLIVIYVGLVDQLDWIPISVLNDANVINPDYTFLR